MPSASPHTIQSEQDEDDLSFNSPTAETALLQRHSVPHDDTRSPQPPHHNYTRVIAVCLCAAFIIDVGDYMQRAPLIRVLEDIICRKHYGSSAPLGTNITFSIPEQNCKIPAVQGPLTMLKGWDIALSCIPGLLFAVPFGYVAEKYGRKIVIVLSLLGITLDLTWIQVVVYFESVFDVRWFWAGNAFLTLGGGSAVLKATLYVVFSDVTPRDKRAAIFFQFTCASTLATFVGAPASWHLMKTSSFLAMGIGIALVASGLVLLILALPETLSQAQAPKPPLLHAAEDITPEEEGSLGPSKPLSILDIIKGSKFVFANPTLCALAFTFVVGPILTYSGLLLVQLTSERYHWSIAESNFVTPFSSAIVFLVLIIFLPTIYSLLGSRFYLPASVRDLVVARGSLIFLVLGASIIAMGPTPPFLLIGVVIMDLGAGYMSAVRSLVTSFVHNKQVSQLYAIIAMIETIASLVSSPVISKAFGWGLELGGIWNGLAYIVTAGMVLIFGIPVWVVCASKQEEDIHG